MCVCDFVRVRVCEGVSVCECPCPQLERLDADLKNYRHNSIKESIRRGYDALGDHHLDCGDLKSAA